MRRLEGKVAIVTGSGQGIGQAIALAYAREGARVVVAELKAHRMERTVAAIRESDGTAIGIAVDMGEREQVERMVASAVEQLGAIDVLVNNAQGYAPLTPLEEIPDDAFDHVVVSGLKGTLWSMRAVLPHMKGRGGRIINFVSLAAERGDPGLGAYNATKMAILGLTRTAAREWGKHDILVNCIAPAAMSKRGQDYAARDPEGFARQMAERPIGRLGDPLDDIAPVAVFLASPEARYLTGHTFYADGGAHISAV